MAGRAICPPLRAAIRQVIYSCRHELNADAKAIARQLAREIAKEAALNGLTDGDALAAWDAEDGAEAEWKKIIRAELAELAARSGGTQ